MFCLKFFYKAHHLYFLLAVSTDDGTFSLRKHRQGTLHSTDNDVILGMIRPCVASLIEVLLENLLKVKS